ncbi:response regulator transcription factor [Cyanobacterium aponinum UTEX 3222]|uniref:Response regulator n=2 Tax=Cyanobacterium aponinum TaxID=379064 RepID=A0A844GPD4_9CHRO|nr:response regulator transcription factor [Cyanobacterium aponinum]WRL41569.1 response regulator transcription factor [Cyanobacterium aponinum UTEX 3222]MTF38434.1 response regulator [Cyanobacterium aponinum 0216]PHV63522.1 DNA-binding response regulator [Cyanobacterium aponinum IPPAS B-1201]WPF89761.1 response regulator transcription factor [Cyanobacterium aponinum AL20115]WRL37952.1 response regulator transcription factor [Cyanobacterium aponinum UTEX 3221]
MSEVEKILLVDDEPGIRESVQAYLSCNDDWDVKVASNAKEAWDKIQEDIPDLIISDIMMPEVDGLQFLAQLRQDSRYSNVPVVFLTAKGMTSDRIEGYTAGCDAYLPKPFDPDELEAIVANLLAKQRNSKDNKGSSNVQLDELLRDVKDIKDRLEGSGKFTTVDSPIKIDLTPREQSVLDLVAQGLMNKEIAKTLDTSVRNVEKYVSRLFSKTGTNSRTELVRFALKQGLTE